MKLTFLYILSVFSLSFHCHAQLRDFGSMGIKGLSSQQLVHLAEEKIVFLNPESTNSGSKGKLIEAAMVFSASPEIAWKLISKTEDQSKYIDGCKEIKVTRTLPGKAYQVHKVGNFMVTYVYGVVQNYLPERKCIQWSLDTSYAKNDLNALSGYWQFYPYGKGKTLARYGSNISFKNLPEFIERTQLKSGVENALTAVKKYVDSGGNYHKQ